MPEFMSLHAIHALPPSLLNRDYADAIKRITIGGTSRVRVSSQSWKRAMRKHVRSTAIEGGAFGIRTGRFPSLVVEALVTHHGADPVAATAKVAAVFTSINVTTNEKGNTSTTIFAPESAPEQIADAIYPYFDTIGDSVPDEVQRAAVASFDPSNAIDIALFGRMLIEIPAGNVTGAVAVSHSFSVDRAAVEPDFWTAADDAAPAAAGRSTMLDSSDLAAPVLYRHAALDRRQLRHNLRGAGDPEVVERLAAAAERAFLDAFIQAVPDGKRRSTAATTLPAVVLGIAAGRDTSFADAYANVIAGEEVLDTAITRLLETAERISKIIPVRAQAVLPIVGGEHAVNVKRVDTVDELAAVVLGELP